MHSLELEAPEPPSRYAPDMEIPADLDYKILQALQKRPQDRYASMLEFQRALENIHPDLPLAWPSPPVAPAPLDVALETRQADLDAAAHATVDGDGPTRVMVRTARALPLVPARRRQIGLTIGALGIAAVAFGVGAWATKSPVRFDQDEVESDPLVARGEALPERNSVAVEVPGPPVVELPPGVPPPSAPTMPDAAPAPVEASGPQPKRSSGRFRGNLDSWDPGPTRPPPSGTQLCDIEPYDRNQMFTPHRDAVVKRCLQNVPPNVVVMVEARVVRGKLLVSPHPNQTGKLRAIGSCIAKYLEANVTVPGRFKKCRTPKAVRLPY